MTQTYLVTGSASGIVVAGSESNLYLQTQNTTGSALTISLSYSLTTVDGAVQSFGTSKVAPAGGTVNFPISIAGQPYGHRWVTFSASSSGYSQTNIRHAFYYAPRVAGQATDTSGFAWGMNPGSGSQATTQDYVAMQQIGIDHVRTSIEWASIEAANGSRNWGQADAEIARAEAYGMRVNWGLWYGRVQDAFGTPPPVSTFVSFVTAFTARYGSRVKWYEIWNEPNSNQFWHGDIPTYITLFKAASDAIRATYAGATITTGGMAGVYGFPGSLMIQGLEQTLLQNASYFDVHMFHPHDVLGTMEQDLAIEAPWRAAMSPSRPLFANEVGIPTVNNTYYPQQAIETIKKIAVAKAVGIIGWTIYQLSDNGTDPTYSENNFGLMTIDRQPKPALGAVNEIIARLRSRTYWGTLAGLANGLRFYTYHGASDYLTIFWNQGGGTAAPVMLECGAGATAFDMWGNAITLPAGTSTQKSATFGANPIYLVSSIAPYVAGTTPGPGPGDPGTGDPGPGPTTISDTVTALLPFSRMRADVRTESAGHVDVFQDLSRSGHTYTATGAKIPAIIGSGNLAGCALAVFTGTEMYSSSLAGSLWSFMHQNHPREIFVVLESRVTSGYADIISTTPGSQVASYQLFSNPTTGAITSAVYGAATQNISCVSPALADGTPAFIRIHSDLSLAPQESMTTNEATTDSQYYGFTPSTATTNATLSIGDGTGAFAIAELIIFDRSLRDDERSVILAYVSNRYGIPAYTDYVTGISPFARFRADKRGESGGKVTEFRDMQNATHRLLQADTTKQIAAIATSALINNRELALFTGTQKYVSTAVPSAWNFLHQNQPKEIFLVVCAINNGSYNNWVVTTADYVSSGFLIYATPSGGIAFATGFGAAQQQGIVSGNFAADTPVVLDYQGHLVADNPDFLLAANTNADLVGNFTFTPVVTDATLTLTLGDTPGDSMKFAELIIFNRLLTPSERAGVRQYVKNYYNISGPTIGSVVGGSTSTSSATAAMRILAAIGGTSAGAATTTLKRNFFTILDLSSTTLPSTLSDSPNEMKSGRWSITVTPSQSSATTFAGAGNFMGVFTFGDLSNGAFYFGGANGYCFLTASVNGSNYYSDALSYVGGSPLTITIDTAAATMKISGAVTGDGTTSLGAPFTLPGGTLYIGRNTFLSPDGQPGPFVGTFGNVQAYYGGAPGAVAGVSAGVTTTVGAIHDAGNFFRCATAGIASTACAMQQATGGTSAGIASTVGAMTGTMPAAGTSAGVAATAASWTARSAFGGSTASTSAIIGAIAAKGVLAGSAGGASTVALTMAAGTPIAGIISGVVSASLAGMVYRVNMPLVPALATAGASGSMVGTGAMAGQSQSVASTSMPGAARGAMAGSSSSVASPTLQPCLATGGSCLTVAFAAAAMGGPGAMAGGMSAGSSGQLTLTGARQATMTTTGVATASAAMVGRGMFAIGPVQCAATVTGVAVATGDMAGRATAAAATACTVGGSAGVAAVMGGLSSALGAAVGRGALLPVSSGAAAASAAARQAVGGTSGGIASAACALGGSGAIVGSSAGITSQVSAVVALGSCSGATSGAAGASLTLGGLFVTGGASSGAAGASWTGAGHGAVAGTSSGVSLTLCAGASNAYGVGAATGSSSSTGAIAGTGAVASSASGTASAVGTVKGSSALGGLASASCSTVCTAGGAAGDGFVAGGTASATGSMVARGNIYATSGGVADPRCTMGGPGAMSGASAGQSSTSLASMETPTKFSQALVVLEIPAIDEVVLVLPPAVMLAASGATGGRSGGAASLACSMQATGSLAAAVACSAITAAALRGAVATAGAVGGAASATCSMGALGAMAAASAGIATSACAGVATLAVSATVNGTASLACAATGRGVMSAAASAGAATVGATGTAAMVGGATVNAGAITTGDLIDIMTDSSGNPMTDDLGNQMVP